MINWKNPTEEEKVKEAEELEKVNASLNTLQQLKKCTTDKEK